MEKWEYRMEVNLGEDREDQNVTTALNALGQEGWELVAVTSVFVPAKSGTLRGREIKASGGSNVAYYFKRTSRSLSMSPH